MIILAGDIGGTHSRLALYDSNSTSTDSLHTTLSNTAQFSNADFKQASDLIKQYLSSFDIQPEVACLALAAPVPAKDHNNDQKITLTNLPWQFHNSALMQELKLDSLCFINDFAGLPYITQKLRTKIAATDLQILQSGDNLGKTVTTEIIVGAGTGLGCVIAHKSPQAISILNSEAGHSDISGAQHQLRDIIRFLQKNSIPLCWESVLSGPGLERLYALISGQKTGSLSAKEITEKAATNINSDEYQTLSLFLTLTGIFSRNMSLNCLPDNVYLVGNIFRLAFNIIPVEIFLQGFHDTTQHQSLLKAVPVTLITDTQIGLKGAIAFAQQNLM